MGEDELLMKLQSQIDKLRGSLGGAVGAKRKATMERDKCRGVIAEAHEMLVAGDADGARLLLEGHVR